MARADVDFNFIAIAIPQSKPIADDFATLYLTPTEIKELFSKQNVIKIVEVGEKKVAITLRRGKTK